MSLRTSLSVRCNHQKKIWYPLINLIHFEILRLLRAFAVKSRSISENGTSFLLSPHLSSKENLFHFPKSTDFLFYGWLHNGHRDASTSVKNIETFWNFKNELKILKIGDFRAANLHGPTNDFWDRLGGYPLTPIDMKTVLTNFISSFNPNERTYKTLEISSFLQKDPESLLK